MFENWKKYLPGNGFWTGRSDLYKDSQRVDYVQNELTTIKGLVPTAQADAQNKLAALNATLANTGYAVQTGALDDVYSFIDNMIGQIQNQIKTKSDTADEYSKNHSGLGGIFQATLATGGMILSKFGEGVASAFEDIGDAVGTCFGWVEAATDAIGLTDKGTQFWADIVKTDVSHNIFHSINEGLGLNKHSYLTEDSGLANLSKAAGVATGYLTMSGWLSGVAEGYGNIRTGARFTKFLASSTNANTIIAGIGGFGSGVENGLQSGQTFARANLTGLAQGGIQAGVAYGMGKLGESIDRSRQIKLADSKYKYYENELAAHPGDAALTAARDAAKADLDALTATKIKIIGKGASNTQFQGYTDPVSMRARQQGKTFGEALAKNVTAGGSSGIKALPKALVQTEGQMIKDGVANAKTAFHDATHNAAGKFSVRTTAGSTLRGARDIVTAPVRLTTEMARNGIATMGVAPVQTIARDALGVVSATGVNGHNSRITEEYEAGQIFGPTPTIDITKPPANPTPTSQTPTTSPTSQTPTTTPTNSPTTTPTYDPGPYGPGGPSGPGDPDPTPTAPPTDPITPTVPVTPTDPTPTAPPTTQTVVIETPTSEPPTGGTPWDDGHSGGEYSGEEGFISDEEMEPELADLVDDAATSIDEIIKGKKYTKIPTSNTPIARPTTSSGNALIPIAAGLSAAAAAGLGAKAYMDRKNNSDNGEDDIYTDDWSDEDTIDVDYDDASAQEGDLEEDYNYQDVETEKYGARNNEELADLQ